MPNMEKIIQQGAEAILIKKSPSVLIAKPFVKVLGDRDKIKLQKYDFMLCIKRRTKKSYRFPLLDEKIRKQRTKREFSLLQKASKLIPIPKIIKLDEKNKEIEMEFIEGKKLSEALDSLPNKKEICIQIGKQIALLHDSSIIHGDLTTSNIILSSKDNLLYFIDFGLGFISSKIEDKAVDLHLIKQALEAKHFNFYKECFSAILEGYKLSKNSPLVLKRMEKVESRGRYKPQI